MDFNDYEFEQRLRTMGGDFLPQRRDAPAPQASGCLSEANPKGRKGTRGAEKTVCFMFFESYFLFYNTIQATPNG
jgi:hypothetical protein